MELQSSSKITADQSFYDQETKLDAGKHRNWMNEIRFYHEAYVEFLNDRLGSSSTVIEMGAGSCGLSLCLSKLPKIKKIYSVDISAKRMSDLMKISNETIHGDIGKVEPVEADFNKGFKFETGSIDAVFFDASLHHCRDIWSVIEECKRILKPGGLLIAQRESYLSPLRAHTQLSELLKTPEVQASVSENMYLKDQYLYYLKVYGFECQFIKRTKSRLKNWLSFLNGSLLFTDGVIVATKK